MTGPAGAEASHYQHFGVYEVPLGLQEKHDDYENH